MSDDARQHVTARDDRDADERSTLLAALRQLVEPLGRAFPGNAEVVLHDLDRLPGSIVAVEGDVTGRALGDPATDLLLERATQGRLETMVGYPTLLRDGRELRSTTMVVRDSAGEPVAALCINADVGVWAEVARIARAVIEGGGAVGMPHPEPADVAVREEHSESFVRDVDELAALLLRQAIEAQGVPVALMRKEHKVAVVRHLKDRGMFLLRDAVEMVAESLGVTRFTIYNYLNEIGEDENR